MLNHRLPVRRHWMLAALIGGMGLTTPVWAETSVVLSDHFDNGVPADTDSVAAFWRIENNAKEGANTLTENQEGNGLLAVTLTGGTGQSMPKVIMRSEITDDFNFATGQITLSVKGLTVRTDGTDAKPWNSGMRFSFTSKSAHPWESPDAIALTLSGDASMQFGWKTAKPSAPPLQVTAVSVSPADKLGSITGFDLTLSNSGYRLVVHGSDKSATFEGAYADKGGLTPWGNAALVVDFQRNVTTTTVTSRYQLGDVQVKRDTP
ncbi:MAG: hypothetical protein ACYC26_15750 [Phycisphaerales bacterium]